MSKPSKHFYPTFWQHENGIKTLYRDLSNSDILEFAANLRKEAADLLFNEPTLTNKTLRLRLQSINSKLGALQWELKKRKKGKSIEKANSYLFEPISQIQARYCTTVECQIKSIKEKK